MKKHIFTYAILLILFLTYPALAKTAETEGKAPLEISAEETLTWDRDKDRYIAKGSVEVKQNNFSIFSDVLMAYYNDKENKTAQNISHIEIDGNVRVSSPPYTAYGDKGEYKVSNNIATLTGENLRIVTPDEIITADDSLEYNTKSQTFIATGSAHVIRDVNSLDADVIIAEFEKQANDTSSNAGLKRVKAKGSVVLSTPTEKIYGENAVYDIITETITITEMVRIEQGKNILKGSKATLNIKTGISQIFAEDNNEKKGRITGIFYPE